MTGNQTREQITGEERNIQHLHTGQSVTHKIDFTHWIAAFLVLRSFKRQLVYIL